MKKRLFLISALFTFCTTLSFAQSFMWHLKKAEDGKGTIVIHQDKSLDYLIDNREPEVDTAETPRYVTVTKTIKVKKRVSRDSLDKEKPKMPELALRRKFVINRDSTGFVSSAKKIMADAQKVPGYRIQLFAGGNTREDRQKAEEIGKKAKRFFPEEPIYTHFYSPRWICRMGNYTSQEKANKMLKRVKNVGITGACVVKGTITVKRGSVDVSKLEAKGDRYFNDDVKPKKKKSSSGKKTE